MKKIFKIVLVILLIFLAPISISSAFSNYIWSTIDLTQEVSSPISTEYTDDSSNPLGLNCGSCILIEQSTGQVLYSYNSHEKLRPASVTKLMSIYLIMEAISSRKNKL